ncbi:MAG: hypothetical protein IPI81_11970 [Flavobacteriales bacterium]|nr:hypothetical protein [Flavobacteriales bacterium]MCC6939120.1 hypothetical protein [Flavobacteriales bacterium]
MFLARLRIPLRSPITFWWTMLTVCMIAIILHFYGHVLATPDHVLLVSGGDGMKNYFTLVWHANRDASLLHYGGSSTPYGEQVFYTDGHPLLSWVLQLLPFLAPHAVGILNVLLLFGLLACAWCLFAVLRELKVAPWAAAIGAFGIALLQPQLFRLGGHLSLAHAWIIPLLFLLLLRTRGSNRWLKWSIGSGLVLLGCFLIHPYLGFMGVLLFLSYYACLLLLRTGDHVRKRRTYLEPVIMAIGPMLLFLVLLGWGDATTDRPASPQGLDRFSSTLMSLIVPTHDPFVTPLREFIQYDAIDWETWCYLGSSSILLLVIAGGVQVKRWTVRSDRTSLDDAGLLLGASFLVLLFAMGFWQDWFGEWMPMLAQFRGAGRFAWVFYFACAVFCTTRLYHWLFAGEGIRRWAAITVYTIVIGFYAREGWAYHVDVSASLGHASNVFRFDEVSAEQGALIAMARKSNAVATIPLPYHHEGSELYQKDAPKPFLAEAMPLAFHSGIPLLAGLTSRASLQRTRNLLALFSPSTFSKRLVDEIPGDAMFLLFRGASPLETEEQALWDKGNPIIENGAGSLRLISAGSLFMDDRADRLATYARLKDAMPAHGEWRVSVSDSIPSGDALQQLRMVPDMITSIVRDYTDVLFVEPGQLDTATTYELSFEFHAVDQAAINISLILEHVRADGTDMHWGILRNVRSMPMQSSDDRTMATLTFTPPERGRSYKFLLKGPDDMGQRFTASHIVLRPVNVDVWREGAWEGKPVVFLNNVPLTSDSRAAAP